MASNRPPMGWWSALNPQGTRHRWNPSFQNERMLVWVIPSTDCPWCPLGTAPPMNGNGDLGEGALGYGVDVVHEPPGEWSSGSP